MKPKARPCKQDRRQFILISKGDLYLPSSEPLGIKLLALLLWALKQIAWAALAGAALWTTGC
jgi:hypothetical protein